MKLKLSNIQVFVVLLLVFSVTLGSGILISVFDNKPFDLYIRITEITWPPPSEFTLQSDTDVVYSVLMVCEIWNPSDTTFSYYTMNLNLVDPQMEIELKEDYSAYAFYGFWMFPNTHEIKPGITEIQAGLNLRVEIYNDLNPPFPNINISLRAYNGFISLRTSKNFIYVKL